MNTLEESIHQRQRQLNGANEQRRELERMMNQFNDWIKTTEQQAKDHLTNDLQQTTMGLKDKYRNIQVSKDDLLEDISCIHFSVVVTICARSYE